MVLRETYSSLTVWSLPLRRWDAGRTLSPGLVGSLALDLGSPKTDLVGTLMGLRWNVKE